MAHLHSSHLWTTQGQGTSTGSTALPIWQEQALTHLNLYGPSANLEVLIGGSPPVDPRLLAAVRVLYCQDPAELKGRALVQLGAWGAFLTPANEVRTLMLAATCIDITYVSAACKHCQAEATRLHAKARWQCTFVLADFDLSGLSS